MTSSVELMIINDEQKMKEMEMDEEKRKYV